MNNAIFIVVVITAVALAGYAIFNFALKNQGEVDLNYEGIPLSDIPSECLKFKNNVCDLFDCMVDKCWCDEANIPSPILLEGKNIISNEEEAMQAARQYVQDKNLGYSEVKMAVRLNNVFFNVFAYNSANEEMTFTVASDGTILKTICGV